MKKLLIILITLITSLAILISFRSIEESQSLLESENLLALNDETISKDNVSLSIQSLNDSMKQLSTDGTHILNTINESKSNLSTGEIAIDIIITNPSNASAKKYWGVRISYDDYILENFDIVDITVEGGLNTWAEYNSSTNEVQCSIPEVSEADKVTLSYKLKLKNTINKNILNTRLNTNRQIIVTEWGSVIGTYPEDSQIGKQICSPTIRLTPIEEGALAVTKKVTGTGANLNKNFNFTVTLSDRNINGTYGNMNFTNGVARFTLSNNQTVTATKLPSNITYRVVETEANQNHYITTVTGETGTITTGETSYVNFTNTYQMPVGNLSVTKIVDGNAGDVNKIFNFTVTLSDRNINGTYGDLYFINGVANFNLKHNQTLKAANIPVDITYTVEEKDANKDDYLTIYDNGFGKRTTEKVTGTITENSNINVKVYNTKENKNFITVNKEFDTTSNFNKDIEINYNSFNNNGITEDTYKKYTANKTLTIVGSNGNIHTSFQVNADKSGKFTIPAKYASNYKEFKINIENKEETLNLTINLEKVIPNIPENIDYHLKAINTASGTGIEKDFTLKSSESYMKSFEIDYDSNFLDNIKITEKTGNREWKFSYTVKRTGNNISIIMENIGGEYRISGNMKIETTPKGKINIEKIWETKENYIDINFTSEDRNNFKINVDIMDSKGKILETVKLDETGHGITTKKYKPSDELYALYPDGTKVKINKDETTIPKEIKVKIGNEIYILTSDNNWKMTITKDTLEDFNVEELDINEKFTSTINKTKDSNGNYEVKITNTNMSIRNVNYHEPAKPIENPKTGISTYHIIGITILLISITGITVLKRKNIF